MNMKSQLFPNSAGVVPDALNQGILSAFSLTQELQDMMVITGAAGTGKTSAARHYQQCARTVWLATMTPASASLAGCLERVARAMGIEGTAHRVSRLDEVITARAFGTGGLLIVDEAQHLSVAALEGLCRLQDQAQIGTVIMAAKCSQRASPVGRGELASPIGRHLALERPEEGDVARLLAAWDVPGKVRELCHWISRQPGALHVLRSILRIALLLAENEGQDLAESHVKAAWSDLRGAA
ncbi:MAG: AAA family ATPase [Solidesulfovibrio sp.]|uniref:AAA family ATPase n=1 Tax=Solidesulfovibrio sp. TaxID=2910990 RepID=UPI003158E630